ncbi:MAG: hypothetical protein HY203_04425 [Nitrospirae bacterium]|nr:hypothetical protein [Nitrospirota bacterium]
MIEMLSGLLTPLIAVLVAYVAWQQWRTNQLRLKHELFDRRFALYEKMTSFIAEILTQGKVPANAETRLLRETKTAIFLFDKEIQDFVQELYRKAADLHALEAMLEKLEGEDRARNVDKQGEIKDWFTSQLHGCNARFSRFLLLGERRTMNRAQRKLLCSFTVFACVLLASIVGVSAFAIFQGIASTQGDVFDYVVFQHHLQWIMPSVMVLAGLLVTGIVGFVGFWIVLNDKIEH